jgi:hypothetical protein
MAFTSAQKTAIRKYLGYPQLNRFRDSRLESAIDVVGADVDASAEVVALLIELAAIDAKITASAGSGASTSTFTGSLKKADEVEWYPLGATSGTGGGATATTASFRDQGRVLCSRLSQLFGIPLWGDYFGGLGYPGDEFMGSAHQGRGGVIPLG